MGDVYGDRYERTYRRYLIPFFGTYNDWFTLTANTVYIVPMEVPYRCVVDRIVVAYYGPVAGNIRACIYRDNGETPVGGALIVESASVAKTGTVRKQEITIADTLLRPGLYWLAINTDESTTNIIHIWPWNLGGTLICYTYALAYGAFTNPCPAAAGGAAPMATLRVRNILPA